MLEDDGDWVRRFHPSPDAPVRLVCFPHAGGSANYFFPVSRTLSSAADVLSMQYPGRQDRRRIRFAETIAEMADRATDALRSWLDRPAVFFGHSMGATVAFEVARRLEAEKITPAALFASGRRAPSTRRVETQHLLPDAELVSTLHRLEGTQAALLDDADLVAMILPAVRNDYRAVETYPPTDARIATPITALVGADDTMVNTEEARAWRKHTTGDFSLRTFPGGHFYLNARAAEVTSLIGQQIIAAGGNGQGALGVLPPSRVS